MTPALESRRWLPADTLPADRDGPLYLRVRSRGGGVIAGLAVRHSTYPDRWSWRDSFGGVDGEITGWAPAPETLPPPPLSEATVSCPGAEAAAGCQRCGAASVGDAQERCRGGESCPAEELWDATCADCGCVICTCECFWCQGSGEQEDEADYGGGAMEPCSGCRGSGLARKQVIW